MKKSDLKNKLAKGGSFKADALFFKFSELVACAKSAVYGNSTLTIKNADALLVSEIDALCEHASGHVNFLDVSFED